MNDFDDDISARLRRSLAPGGAPELSPDIVTGAASHPAPRLSNPGRTLRIAGGAGLAVAAVAAVALVVPAALTPAPLFTAAAGSGATPGAAEDSISSRMKIGWWVDYNYSAGAGLSTEGGSGQVYRLVLDGDPQERAAAIADVFGVAGTPAAASYSDPASPVWTVGPEDGSAPTVSVSWWGAGDWWYSDPAAASFYLCDPSVTADQAVDYGCTMPEDAPANLAPSEAEARTKAQALLAATGFTVDAADITTYADDWSTTATANLRIDGAKTALDWSVTWSNTGEISWAYGHTVSVESQGSYGTISAKDAVARLDDGRWWGAAGPDYQGGAVMFAADARAGDTPAEEPAAEPTAEPTDPTDPAVDPVPTEIPVDPTPLPVPTPEVVDVTVDTAEPTLLLMWDADGGAWLVPGYAMKVADGWWSSVVSLVEGVIALPEPIVVDTVVPEEGLVD